MHPEKVRLQSDVVEKSFNLGDGSKIEVIKKTVVEFSAHDVLIHAPPKPTATSVTRFLRIYSKFHHETEIDEASVDIPINEELTSTFSEALQVLDKAIYLGNGLEHPKVIEIFINNQLTVGASIPAPQAINALFVVTRNASTARITGLLRCLSDIRSAMFV